MTDRRFGGVFWGAAALLIAAAAWTLLTMDDDKPKRAQPTSRSSSTSTTAKKGSTTSTTEPFASEFGTVAFTVTTPAREGVGASTKSGCALLASTTKQLERGLMGRKDLAGYDAMVFRFDRDLQVGFHMKNVPVPLDIAWFGSDGKMVGATTMPPCAPEVKDCPAYRPEGSFRTAMETFEGGLTELGVGPGSVVTYTGTCSVGA